MLHTRCLFVTKQESLKIPTATASACERDTTVSSSIRKNTVSVISGQAYRIDENDHVNMVEGVHRQQQDLHDRGSDQGLCAGLDPSDMGGS
jgi:hypothetical protein